MESKINAHQTLHCKYITNNVQMTLEELNKFLQGLPDQIIANASDVVVEQALRYFKQTTFRNKGFDGNPWAPTKKPNPNGSLLLRSGHLRNSIQLKEKSNKHIVFTAGDSATPYAAVHNDGMIGPVDIKAHVRHTKRGPINVAGYTANMNIPRRRFMGDSTELNNKIKEDIENYIKSILP